MVVLLERITQQLAAISNVNTSVSASPLTPGSSGFVLADPYVPPASAVVCNVLWFLSLGFLLACALSATLVEQWTRNYLLATESRPTPHERARVFEYLYKGLERFHMTSVVEAIPMLLHISLFLFFIGLVEFLRPVNFVISMLVLAILLSCVLMYTLATIIPTLQRNCPYGTPLSGWLWSAMKALHLLRYHESDNGRIVEIASSMAHAREMEAIEISDHRDQRDLDAMCWTLKALREDTELESFIEVIPRVVAGSDYSAKLLLHKLLHYDDLSVKLSHRLSRLLLTCSGGLLDPALGQKRATTCLAAIWSLSMMSILSEQPSSPSPSRLRDLRFDDLILRDMVVVKAGIPGVANYVISTMAVVARGILDMYLENMVENEQILLTRCADCLGIWHQEKVSQHHHISSEYMRISNTIHRASQGWEKHLHPREGPVSMSLCVVLSCIDRDLVKLVSISTAETEDPILATETLKLLRDFRAMVNQSGFSLAVEYAANIVNGRSPPFEAFKTIRRLFLRIDLSGNFSVESQRRLVAVLDGALDPDPMGEIHIPQSTVNIILRLTTAVKDQTSAIKAMNIISRSIKFFPDEYEAHKALSVLNNAVPQLTPTLDLFSSHMYANTKL